MRKEVAKVKIVKECMPWLNWQTGVVAALALVAIVVCTGLPALSVLAGTLPLLVAACLLPCLLALVLLRRNRGEARITSNHRHEIDPL
jgi:hypothetical protein